MNALIQIPFAWQKSTGAILCMVFALFLMTSGCENSSNAATEDNEMTLTGTAWKLVGVVDTETGELKELEPNECNGCYTFTFDTDSTAIGRSASNTLGVILRPVVRIFLMTDVGGENIIFTNAIGTIISYELSKNELTFYCNDGKNYLTCKKLGG